MEVIGFTLGLRLSQSSARICNLALGCLEMTAFILAWVGVLLLTSLLPKQC